MTVQEYIGLDNEECDVTINNELVNEVEEE